MASATGAKASGVTTSSPTGPAWPMGWTGATTSRISSLLEAADIRQRRLLLYDVGQEQPLIAAPVTNDRGEDNFPYISCSSGIIYNTDCIISGCMRWSSTSQSHGPVVARLCTTEMSLWTKWRQLVHRIRSIRRRDDLWKGTRSNDPSTMMEESTGR